MVHFSVPDWDDNDALALQEIGDEIMHDNAPNNLCGKDCLRKWNNLKQEHKKHIVRRQKSGQGAVKPSIFDEPINAILGNVHLLSETTVYSAY